MNYQAFAQETCKIELTKNVYALIDKEDYELVSQYHWTYDGRYARRNFYKNNKPTKVYLHRFILGSKSTLDIDHINRDKLDNRRSNLRLCSRTENSRNKNKSKNNTSGISGVYWHKAAKKWAARIRAPGKSVHLGVFDDINLAKKVRQDAERKYWAI